MKVLLERKWLLGLVVFGLLCGLSLPALADEGFRMWKNFRGASFEARLVSADAFNARLANREGKEISYPIAQLSGPDQAFVRANMNGSSSAGSAKPLAEDAFAARFAKDLVKLEGGSVRRYAPQDLGQVDYFAFYYSAHWCPPCRKFTPELAKFYRRTKEKHPNFELIFVSSDRGSKGMETYMEEAKMPWPAFKHGKHKGLVRSNGNGIPCLVVTDADGNKLLDSYNGDGQYVGPSQVLRKLEDLLDQ